MGIIATNGLNPLVELRAMLNTAPTRTRGIDVWVLMSIFRSLSVFAIDGVRPLL